MFWYYRNSILEALHQPPEMESPNNLNTLVQREIESQNENAKEKERINHAGSSFQVFKPTILMVIDKIKPK